MNWLEALNELKEWLESREWEIATGMEDFDKLQGIFRLLIGREAKS